ncbi:GCN5-related N-acetyltransferase [Rubrobacter xylanophilus DSM 9941]|uniref:GCN5-related N-acetyltransferase n=1 Tax=Rubrobacter xylanophilus (strain DSM 9941 / JCM 11954 / NBRC 16129 / PRD-1) TaxID=266117 RepID=Q1ARI8_RUBXD|nr:GNAT family N-acetyltransferase [Rubrobacter xylanophilus]ABG05990.1 GCN5-related N-acetyltransferase [Rubrobacter xylanophilus DSM 9941]
MRSRAGGTRRPSEVERGFLELEDGTLVQYRPISPHDKEALKRFHRRLSWRSVYLRYFGSMKELPDRKAGRLARLGGGEGFALVALDPEHPEEIIAIVLYVREGEADRAEYAALVEDRWQGRGLGLGLTRRLADIAAARGVRRFWGVFLPENTRMLNLLRDLGLPERFYLENGLEHVEIDLLAEGGCDPPGRG